MIADEVKEQYVKDLIKSDKRADGRSLQQYRTVKVTKGLLHNAEGSALVEIGMPGRTTKVLCGIKIDVVEPFGDKPSEGVLTVNAEFSPMAHPEFNAGPPTEDSIELARVCDRGVRSAEAVEVKKLFIEEGKVYGVFADVYILDHFGNLIDAAALAVMAALLDAKLPDYANGELNKKNMTKKLPLTRSVVATTVEKIDGKIVVDATNEEEVASDGRLTLATCDGDLLCAAQKSGKAGFTKEEMLEIARIALEKGKELRKLIA